MLCWRIYQYADVLCLALMWCVDTRRCHDALMPMPDHSCCRLTCALRIPCILCAELLSTCLGFWPR